MIPLPGWLGGCGVALAGLAALLLLRRRPAGWLPLLAALGLAAAGLFHLGDRRMPAAGPQLLVVGTAAAEGELRVAVNEMERALGPLDRMDRLPPGGPPPATGESAAAPFRWPVLAGAVAAAGGRRPLHLVVAAAGLHPGRARPALGAGLLTSTRLFAPPPPPLPPPPPRLALLLPRPARRERPCLVLVRGTNLVAGARYRGTLALGGAAAPVSLEAEADGAGRLLLAGEVLPRREGALALVATVVPAEGGPGPRVRQTVAVGPPPRVAVVGDAGLAGVLATQGFAVQAWSGAGSPPEGAEVVAWAGPGGTPDLAPWLAGGGGLLVVGEGLRALAATGLASRLPLRPLPPRERWPGRGPDIRSTATPDPRPDTPATRPPPPRPVKGPKVERLAPTSALVIVLDVSGSIYEQPGLIETLKASCRLTATALDPGDRVAIITMGKRSKVLLPLGPAGARRPWQKRLPPADPDRPTLLNRALDRALLILGGRRFAVRKVLVFTDGWVMWEGGMGGSGASLRSFRTTHDMGELYRRQGISISYVAYVPGYGKDLRVTESVTQGTRVLQQLAARTGGDSHLVKDLRKVVQAFLAVARAGQVAPDRRPDPPQPAPPKPAPPKPAPTPEAPPKSKPRPLPVRLEAGGWLVEALRGRELPPLAGLTPATPVGELVWVPLTAGPARRPVLAQRRLAADRVVAWTADAGTARAKEWLDRGLLAPLLGRAVTALLPPEPPRPAPVCRWSREGDALVVRWPEPVPGAGGPVRILGPDGAARTALGRWEGVRRLRLPHRRVPPGSRLQVGAAPPIDLPPPVDRGRAAAAAATWRRQLARSEGQRPLDEPAGRRGDLPWLPAVSCLLLLVVGLTRRRRRAGGEASQ